MCQCKHTEIKGKDKPATMAAEELSSFPEADPIVLKETHRHKLLK
jgi:hypothetical protein